MAEALPVVFTVGRSTRALEEFVRLLEAHAIACVADVRTVPRSRRNPQFNRETLPNALEQICKRLNRRAALAHATMPASSPDASLTFLRIAVGSYGIGYVPLPALGGLRHPRADSPNTGWRNASFRGFADYMATPEFAAGLAALIGLAAQQRTAVMCAEAVPWRCYRSLISDALLVRGVVTVEHILSESQRKPHTLTPWARVSGTALTYPPEAPVAESAAAGP